MSGDLTDDYAAKAESYERQPPRRDEMVGEPVLNPRTAEPPDAATGEWYDPGAVSGDSRAEPRRLTLAVSVPIETGRDNCVVFAEKAWDLPLVKCGRLNGRDPRVMVVRR